MPDIKVTPKNFPRIKKMLEYDVKQAEVAEFFELSDATVSYIDRSDTLEEYRKRLRENRREYYQKNKASTKTVDLEDDPIDKRLKRVEASIRHLMKRVKNLSKE